MQVLDYISAGSVKEVVGLLNSNDGRARILCGGTDLLVQLRENRRRTELLIDVKNIHELTSINYDDQLGLWLGAAASCHAISQDRFVSENYPGLVDAIYLIGGVQIQYRASVGGNLCNASPAADSPPALLAYDAQLELTSAKGRRWVAYNGFHTGYKEMNIRDDELLTRIQLRRSKQPAFHYYRKVGTRKAQAISKVCFSGVAHVVNRRIEEVRIALGSVAPIPLRCLRTESVLRGQTITASLTGAAEKELAQEVTPIDDIRSTKAYRLRVSQNLLGDFLSKMSDKL